MAEQEAVATADPPADAPPSEEPKPVEQADETPAEEPKPDVDEPKPDETPGEGDTPSAFEKMTEGLTDPDEIEAVRAQLLDRLPEDRRQPKADPTEADTQSTLLAEQRRQEGKRENEAKREGAVQRMNGHLKQVKQRLGTDPDDPKAWAKVEGFPDDYDTELLSGAINEIVAAENALADQGARELFSTALSHRLQRHGGPVADDRFKELIKAVADNKVEHGIVGAYLDEWGERRYQEGLTEGQAAAKSKDEGWRKAESAAVRAEQMSERELEPDAGRGKPVGGSEEDRLERLAYGRDKNGNTPSEEDVAWLAARN